MVVAVQFAGGSSQTSAQVARLLDIPYWLLHSFIRNGEMTEPARDGGGRFQWSARDVQAARDALAARRARRQRDAAIQA